MTARAGTVRVDSLVERCGAALDSRGVRWADGLLKLIFAPSSAQAVPLTTEASLVFWEDATSPLTFPDTLGGSATVVDAQGQQHVAALGRASLTRPSAGRFRWSARFTGDTAEVTADGEDDLTFAPATDSEPSDRPLRADAGMPPPDAGTPCSDEFGVTPTLPQVTVAPQLRLLSREQVGDALCGGGLAWLGVVEVSGSDLGAVTSVEVALPGRPVQAARFVADAQQVTFVACSAVGIPRLFARLSDGTRAADVCGRTYSGAATPCPFPTSLPAPSADFQPPFTRTSASTASLCSGGLRLSYTFDTDVRVSGYTVEQPYGRLQRNAAAVSSPGWRFDSCLSVPGVGVYAVQLTTVTGLQAPPVCVSE